MIEQISPTRINLIGYEDRINILKLHLEYIDKSIDYDILKFKKNQIWYIRSHSPEEYEEKLQELKDSRKQSLLFQDDDGTYWTYSGLAPFLINTFSDTFSYKLAPPEPKLIPFDHGYKHDPRPYQVEGVDLLINIKHGAVEYPTGSGKSLMISMLCKHYGLKTVVTTPSISIAGQIYKELVYTFGKKYVGKFYQGKKESDKLFIVAVNNSLMNVEKGDDYYNDLKSVQVVIADESHRVPSETLSKVFIEGPLKNAYYRLFVSGTQFRHDGKDLLLEAITGPVVKHLTVEELVKQGYLAAPTFRTVWINSSAKVTSDDPKRIMQGHIYKNPQVAQVAAEIINDYIDLMKLQVVVLIEEFTQFTQLLPYLKHDFRFVHSGVTKDNKKKIPKEYHKVDVDKCVQEFNELKVPLLIGTDCITTGTDMPPIGAIIYLKGINSPIDVAQAAGRGTRLWEDKEGFVFVDIGIENVTMLKNQANKRIKIYKSIYDNWDEIRI